MDVMAVTTQLCMLNIAIRISWSDLPFTVENASRQLTHAQHCHRHEQRNTAATGKQVVILWAGPAYKFRNLAPNVPGAPHMHPGVIFTCVNKIKRPSSNTSLHHWYAKICLRPPRFVTNMNVNTPYDCHEYTTSDR